MAQIAAERAKRGKFKDLFDFAERIDPKMINKRALENLARAGAFDSLEPDRARALAACELVAAVSAKAMEERNSPQTSLFGDAEPLPRPPLPKVPAWSAQERLDNERESVGFYVSGHPLDDFLAHAPADRYATYADILEEGETEPRFYNMAGVVRRVQLRPAQSGGMLAYVSMSDPTAEFELMIMPENVQRAREQLEVGRPVLFKARARWRDGDLKMSADAFEPIEAAEARVMGDLKIIVSENASMTALAETFAALRNAPRNGSDSRNLRLILKLQDGREIELAVKGQYPAGASARAALKAAKGVERVA
jgi:DNA polymerase-3 subunit alpha